MTANSFRGVAARPVGLAAAALCAVAVVACRSAAPPSAAESMAARTELECAARSELGCIDSPECTLRQGADERYICTEAADECERGFVQHSGRAEECAAGCVFSPAVCYCSPDVTCICSGGPPPQCRKAD